MVKRICVIGAGPAGLSVLYQFEKARSQHSTSEFPELVCYEKQSTYGGMWNFTWRTGLDEHGETIPNGMYHGLWSNAPKEVSEYSDYTYEKHFNKIMPSFLPREVIRDYMVGRFNQVKTIFDQIQYNTVVQHVSYRPETDDFEVTIKDLSKDKVLSAQTFDHVIVCSSHYSVPNIPEIPNLNDFIGHIMHAHDLRDMRQFEGKRLLVIGSNYSGEDMALLGIKYGAKKINLVYHKGPPTPGLKWPKDLVNCKPAVDKITSEKTVRFVDETEAEVDVIIFCTGYIHHHPFMSEKLRFNEKNSFYPPGLYQGILWLGNEKEQKPSANNRVFYIGMQDLAYSFPLFDLQACLARDIILGKSQLPPRAEMIADTKKWVERVNQVKGLADLVNIASDHLVALGYAVGWSDKLDARHLFMEWAQYKADDILSYRDRCFKSLHTGNLSISNNPHFMSAMDDTFQNFINRH